ncbi:MAG: acyltransferase [Acidobacteriota bacterium]
MLDSSVFLHAHALCESEDVGARTRIWAFAHVMRGARVGSDCNVGDHAYIEAGAVVGNGVTVKNGVMIWDKVTIEDDVFIGPGAVFTNDPTPRAHTKKPPSTFAATVVKRGATIGANATVVCGVTVGPSAFVGAGAVVVRDVAAHALVVGVPARRVGWACRCGLRLPRSLRCSCGLGYALLGERQGLRPASESSSVRKNRRGRSPGPMTRDRSTRRGGMRRQAGR